MNNTASIATVDTDMEREIQSKGKTAPRVTLADLQANIVDEVYFTAADGVRGNFADLMPPVVADDGSPFHYLTFCVLVLRNGFTVTGESACASPENFDAEIGRKIARQNAEQKIWPLMGYALKERLHQSTQPAQVPQATTREQHLEAAAGHVSAANALQAGK